MISPKAPDQSSGASRVDGGNSRTLDLIRRLRVRESPNVTFVGGSFPAFWDRARGSRVWDVDGKEYLDFTSAFGVASIGHCHPDVVLAIQRQAERLIHGMGDVHPSAIKVDLLERIASHVPLEDPQIILGQNGSDAVEAALKTARLATGKSGVLAFEGGYHGLSYGALSVTWRDDFRAPFAGQIGSFAQHLPFGCQEPAILSALRDQGLGAVIVEPIQGRGGIRVPPPGWLAMLARACRTAGVLLILDEIFTGWGRTGVWFACMAEAVVPDILCIGKAMGGGLPISACVASASVMAAWGESRGEALHTSTFLGNPLACSAALAAIAVMERECLPEQAAAAGASLREKLEHLARLWPDCIVEVRGRGLMLGLQMRDSEMALALTERLLLSGVIVLPAGDGSVIELVPPLNVTADEIELAASSLDFALSNIPQEK